MKKFYSLALALLAVVGMQAATPTLLFQGAPVVDGGTYTTGWTVEVQDLGVMKLNNYIQNSDLYLYGPEGAEVTLEIKASAEVQVCSITGQCAMAENLTRTGFIGEVESDIVAREDDNVTIDLKIDKMTQDITGADPATLMNDITVQVTAYYVDAPADKVTVTVVMSNKSAEEVGGITGVVVDGSNVTVRGNVVSYNFASPTALALYGSNGALVMKRVLKGEGSIVLDALRPGVYVYTADGMAGKMLIRK